MKTLVSIGVFLVLAFVAASILFPSHPISVVQAHTTGTSAVQAQADVVQPRSSAHTYSVIGKPTITAAHINTILDDVHSPAAGTGQAMYDLGVKYGIDPIFALAFFQHESSFGRNGWGATNRSLGNIRCTQGYQCGGGYRAYATWQAGYEDWYALIRNLYVEQLQLVTVAQIAPVYAPSADHNSPVQYINAVESSVSLWRTQR